MFQNNYKTAATLVYREKVNFDFWAKIFLLRKRWVHETASSTQIHGSCKQSIEHKTQLLYYSAQYLVLYTLKKAALPKRRLTFL